MKDLPIEREAILPRIDGIRKNLRKLTALVSLPFESFSQGDPYDLAQHHLRLALEGIFHISTHILSRLPGGRATEYKEVAIKMGELRLVPQGFARKALVPMAGMRNVLVHHYADIDPRRLYDTIRNHRNDIEKFLACIKLILEKPKKFGLRLV